MAQYGDFADEAKKESWSVSNDGIITLTETITVDHSNLTSAFDPSDEMDIDSAHPTYAYLRKTGGTVTYKGFKDVWERTRVYQGIDTTFETYRLEQTTSQEPIETHPDFVDEIGGTGADPLNNAVFDSDEETAELKYFPSNAPQNLGGVSDYLVSGVTLQHIKVKTCSTSCPNWESLDKVATQGGPGSCEPTLPDAPFSSSYSDGYEWLMVGCSQEKIGGALRVQYNYRLSGPKGWNDLIYKDNNAPANP